MRHIVYLKDKGWQTPKGRPLSRAPKPHELKHDFDAHADWQERTAKKVGALMRTAAPALYQDAARRAAALPVGDLQNLHLPPARGLAAQIAKELTLAHQFGQQAVHEEHSRAVGKRAAHLVETSNPSADQDQPNLIAQATVSNLQNFIRGRAHAAAVDAHQRGLTKMPDLENWIVKQLEEGSDASLDRYADEAGRSAVSGGRWDAFQSLDPSDVAKYTRSEAMDHNTCDTCAEHDGDEWDSLDDVDWSPGDDCDGKDACRGQLIAVYKDEGTIS